MDVGERKTRNILVSDSGSEAMSQPFNPKSKGSLTAEHQARDDIKANSRQPQLTQMLLEQTACCRTISFLVSPIRDHAFFCADAIPELARRRPPSAPGFHDAGP